jgi:hypothetical protein
MEENLTLNEIELKLFLLKKRTEKAIKRNEATMLKLKLASQERDAFLASLDGRPPPILEDDSLYNGSLGSSTTEHSDPEFQMEDFSSSGDSDERLSIHDESRDDGGDSSNKISSKRANELNERHGREQDSLASSSYESSVTTTASSTASRVEAFLRLAATEERRILARLDRLRSRLNSESDTANAQS